MPAKVQTKIADQEKIRREIVSEFFQLINEGRPKEGLRFFTPDCKTHNPYVKGGMEALLDAMAAFQKEEGPKYTDPDFSLRAVLADGDMIAAHTELLSSRSNPSKEAYGKSISSDSRATKSLRTGILRRS